MKNEVTSFMLYMFNQWSLAESRSLFGNNLGDHVWSKFHETVRAGGGDHLRFYANLDNDCRQKLVNRANELYS